MMLVIEAFEIEGREVYSQKEEIEIPKRGTVSTKRIMLVVDQCIKEVKKKTTVYCSAMCGCAGAQLAASCRFIPHCNRCEGKVIM
jgi:hypothetical protein